MFFNQFSSPARLQKPTKPLKVATAQKGIYADQPLSTSGANQWAGKMNNFLLEVMKFYPDYAVDEYEGQDESKFYHDYCNWDTWSDTNPSIRRKTTQVVKDTATGITKEVAIKQLSDGQWVTSEVDWNIVQDAANTHHVQSYGFFHAQGNLNQAMQDQGWLEGAFDGTYYDNVDFHANAGQYDHIKNGGMASTDNMQAGSIGGYGAISSDLWTAARAYLQDKPAFYDMAMNRQLPATDYDAFLIMVGLVESRRRYDAAMGELWGIPSFATLSNDQAMIGACDQWLNDPGRGEGANAMNMMLFKTFFTLSHPSEITMDRFFKNGYNTPLPTNELVDPGYHGIDWQRIKTFRDAVYQGALNYMEPFSNKVHGTDTPNPADVAKLASLKAVMDDYEDVKAILPHRHNKDANPGATTKGLSWDRYLGNNKRSVGAGWESETMSLFQMCGLTDEEIQYGANPNNNWAVHDYSVGFKMLNRVISDRVSARTFNRRKRADYKHDMKQYNDLKDDLTYEQQYDASKLDQKAAERRAEEQASEQAAAARKKAELQAAEKAS
jgi:hypothetical protein